MRSRSRIAGLAAVAARYCVSREARASFHVQRQPLRLRAGQRAGGDRQQQHACALRAVARPRRRGLDQAHHAVDRVDVGAVRGQVGERDAAQRAVLALRRAGREEADARRLADLRERLGEPRQVGGRDAAGGGLGPELLLVERQPVGAHGLPVLGDDGAAPGRVVGHRDQPLGVAQHRPGLAAPALPPARRLGRDERAGLVEVDVEQAVERDRAVGVRRGRIDEVDDDAGLLAAVQAHDAADALLVDAAAGRRREVHADRRARARSSPRRAAAR